MTALLLALSLSNSFTKVGAIVAFAAIVGIALLAMLFFAQARELKRLREWSEEEPRRLAEVEQRLSSALALRIQRATAQVARPAAPARAVSAGVPATQVAPDASVIKLLPAAPAIIAGAAMNGTVTETAAEEPDVAAAPEPELPVAAPVRAKVPEEAPALAAVAAEASSLTASASPASPLSASPPPAPPVPVRAADPARSSSVPPAAPPPSAPRAPTPPPRPARATPRRPVDSGRPSTPGPAPRRSAPPLSNGRSQYARRPVRRRGGPPPGPPFLREERSPGRGRLLIAGGAIVVVVLLIVLLTSGGGSSNKGATKTTSPSTLSSSTGETTATTTHHSESSLPASNPSETHVVVLNATETGGLAHRLSGNLQQSGYTLATALNGHPPGHSATVVEYAPGHRTDARHVAQTLGVSQTQPLQSSIAAMDGGSATVVVVAGADLAGAGGGEAPSSGGEAPASTGEAAGGTGQ
jgi:hypothetical protein